MGEKQTEIAHYMRSLGMAVFWLKCDSSGVAILKLVSLNRATRKNGNLETLVITVGENKTEIHPPSETRQLGRF